MSSTLIIVAVGVAVASLAAYASSWFIPSEETTSTEDRLSALARSGTSSKAVKAQQPSLLMSGGFDETQNAIDE